MITVQPTNMLINVKLSDYNNNINNNDNSSNNDDNYEINNTNNLIA